MSAVDSSIAVAAFAPWHERHEGASLALDEQPQIAVHSVLETYSVLTRLPSPLRMPAAAVREFLAREFPRERRLPLGRADQVTVIERLARVGVEGGAVYDGLIAFTARAHDTDLLTFDRRALATYVRCGIRARLAG